ncbi:hypothetical protein GALMADRAFT_809064 [Galerina marginata CBS 339.88]|uniref:Uncharacterized protein n=1 Tax=Galerina marginata (strain CBS 339.88) TaxID=685588 RepID=A0A067SWP3_GALM3|nr:hypothetical protein GALMADRAFT_809064 [Galerina marginata CBS 339.88]
MEVVPPLFWFIELPALLRDTSWTPGLQRQISDISLLTLSRRWYERSDGWGTNEPIQFLQYCLEDRKSALIPMRILDQYMMANLGEYYADSFHNFLVALVGIGAEYVHYPCKRVNGSIYQMHGDVEALFSPYSARDRDHLHFCDNLSSKLPPAYKQQVRIFLQDPSRSGALALNGERYAVAALHCLKILCDEMSPIPPRGQDSRKQGIRRNRPWVLRKILGPNDTALQKYKRHLGKKKRVVLYDFWEGPPKPFTRINGHCQSRVFRWLLRCLRRLLERSTYSKELVDYASRHSFSNRCQDWPYKTKFTRDAINRYIDACQTGDMPL